MFCHVCCKNLKELLQSVADHQQVPRLCTEVSVGPWKFWLFLVESMNTKWPLALPEPTLNLRCPLLVWDLDPPNSHLSSSHPQQIEDFPNPWRLCWEAWWDCTSNNERYKELYIWAGASQTVPQSLSQWITSACRRMQTSWCDACVGPCKVLISDVLMTCLIVYYIAVHHLYSRSAKIKESNIKGLHARFSSMPHFDNFWWLRTAARREILHAQDSERAPL